MYFKIAFVSLFWMIALSGIVAQKIDRTTATRCQPDSCANEFCYQFYERQHQDKTKKKLLLNDRLIIRVRISYGVVVQFSVESLRGIRYHQQIIEKAFQPMLTFPCLEDGLHLIPFKITSTNDPYPADKLDLLLNAWLDYEKGGQKAIIWEKLYFFTGQSHFNQSRLPHIYYPDDHNN